MKETFGQRLSRLRKEKGLTQEEIASRITISPQAVSKWENDLSSPDILVLSSLADILGTSVDELLGRKSEESKEETREEPEVEVVDKEPEVQKDKVTIDNDGIHVISEDGDRVEISDKGIEIIDANGKKVKKNDEPRVGLIISGIVAGLALIGMILMGLLWKEHYMGWKLGWILLLFVPIAGSIESAIRKRRFCHVAYPVIIVAVYCALGFLGIEYGFVGFAFWWWLFLTIPAYYLIFGPIDKHLLHKGKDEDEDEE